MLIKNTMQDYNFLSNHISAMLLQERLYILPQPNWCHNLKGVMLSVDKGNGYHGSGDINTYVQLDLL